MLSVLDLRKRDGRALRDLSLGALSFPGSAAVDGVPLRSEQRAALSARSTCLSTHVRRTVHVFAGIPRTQCLDSSN